MSEKPILFNGEMVRAILDERKTETRRVVKLEGFEQADLYETRDGDLVDPLTLCPYGKPGDRLWVRETWQLISPDENWRPAEECKVIYRATDNHPGYSLHDYAEVEGLAVGYEERMSDPVYPWRPSIFMPRWASRITLEVTGVRVERVQEITEEDARAEGITDGGCLNCGEHEPCGCADPRPDARDAFIYLWNSINAKRGFPWSSDPFVWVVEFKRITQTGGE